MPGQSNKRFLLTIPKFLRFTKIEHTIFSVPFLFAGAWLGADGSQPPLRTLLLILMAGLGARIMGMAMNRILDRDIDALNPRTKNREIPNGQMSLYDAYAVAGIGFLVYLAACFALGGLSILLSPIPALVLVSYSLLKRFTNFCHYGIGVCLLLAPVSAYIAVANRLPQEMDILLLTLFTFCWMSGFDIIYALQDIDFDRQMNIYSLPALLGHTGAQVVAAITHLAALSFAIALVILLGGHTLAWIAVSISALAFILAYIPNIPLRLRFFPISIIAGIAGAVIPLIWQG